MQTAVSEKPQSKQTSNVKTKIISGTSSNLSTTIDDCRNSANEQPQHFLKPVTKPDFTNAVQDLPSETASKEDNASTIKLVDAIRPSDLEWHKQVTDIQSLPKYYKSLSKFRLTGELYLSFFKFR